MNKSDLQCNKITRKGSVKVKANVVVFVFPFFSQCFAGNSGTHRIHVWYIYLHLVDFDGV